MNISSGWKFCSVADSLFSLSERSVEPLFVDVFVFIVAVCLGRIPIAAVGSSGAASIGFDTIDWRRRLCAR